MELKKWALCSVQSSGGAVHWQRCCCAARGHEGRHLPGFSGGETRGVGGVSWLAWGDPLSAPRFLLSEREESQRLTRAIRLMSVWSSYT